MISGSLEVVDSRDISDLSPLLSITHIGGSLQIQRNDALVYMDGLSQLASVGGEVRISSNPVLVNIIGLWNLTSVNGLYLEDNPKLANVDGAYNLVSDFGDLVIAGNSKLPHLYGLWNLQSVGGDLLIVENANMINLDALFKVESVAGLIEVRGNPSLASCGAGLYELVKSGHVGGGVSMHGNAGIGDCNSNGAILKPAQTVQSSRPILASPTNGSAVEVDPFVELLWNRMEGAQRYDVQVALDPSFAIVLFSENVPNVRSKFRGAEVGATYYWRTRALGLTEFTEWSRFASFVTRRSNPDPVILIHPINGLAGTPIQPLFQWVDADSTVLYEIQIASDASFTSPIIDDLDLTEPYDLPSVPLEHNAVYYWRVRARNVAGVGGWSETRSFRTGVSAPDTVALESPENGAAGVPVLATLSWQPIQDVAGYHLQVSSSAGFEDLAIDDSLVVESSVGLDEALQHRTNYHWRVRAVRDDGLGKTTGFVSGPWSETRSFTTEVGTPPAVTLESPADGESGVPAYATLSWYALEDVVGYHLQIAADEGFMSLVTDDSLLTKISLTLPGPLPYGGTFYWHVRGARDTSLETPNGLLYIYGPWSETRSLAVAVGTKAGPDDVIPGEFALHQNYPNPFNPSTTISYDVPEAGLVRLTVFDASGRTVEVLADGNHLPGRHSVIWEPRGLASGLYLVKLESGMFSEAKRILLLK